MKNNREMIIDTLNGFRTEEYVSTGDPAVQSAVAELAAAYFGKLSDSTLETVDPSGMKTMLTTAYFASTCGADDIQRIAENCFARYVKRCLDLNTLSQRMADNAKYR